MKRKNYSGTYRKLKSGAYEIGISLGYEESKRIRHYKTVYVNSDEDAEKELNKFVLELADIKINNDKANFHRQKYIKEINKN